MSFPPPPPRLRPDLGEWRRKLALQRVVHHTPNDGRWWDDTNANHSHELILPWKGAYHRTSVSSDGHVNDLGVAMNHHGPWLEMAWGNHGLEYVFYEPHQITHIMYANSVALNGNTVSIQTTPYISYDLLRQHRPDEVHYLKSIEEYAKHNAERLANKFPAPLLRKTQPALTVFPANHPY